MTTRNLIAAFHLGLAQGGISNYNARPLSRVFAPLYGTLLAVAFGLSVIPTAQSHAATLTWDIVSGDGGTITNGSGNWVSGGGNWNTGAGDTTWNNATPDSAIFGGGTGAAGTVTLTTPITADDITFNAPGGGGNYVITGNTLTLSGSPVITTNVDATISSSIAGSVPIAKAGSATLTLNSPNSYTGVTNINAGAINIQHNRALGGNTASTNSVVIAAGAALQIQGNIFTNQEGFNISGTGVSSDGAIRNISGVNNINGAIVLAGSGVRINSDAGLLIFSPNNNNTPNGNVTGSGVPLTIGGSGNISFANAITTGSGTLTKDGTGTLGMFGAHTYTGVTTINNGTILLGRGESAGSNGPLGNSAASNPGSIVFGGGTLQYSSQNNNDYSGRFSTANGQALRIDTNGRDVTFATALTSSGGSLTKIGAGTLTLNNTGNTYSGGTTVNGGTLLATSAANLPTSGTLTVNGGGTFSMVGGGAVTTYATDSLNLSQAAGLAFDWSGASADLLTSTSAATASGIIAINLTTSSASGSPTLISALSGGLTSGGASYYLANNTNYTAALSVSDTAISVGSFASQTALVNNAFWFGNKVATTNTPGLDNAMAISGLLASNWSTTSGSYTSTGLVPGPTANVVFSATGATQQSNIVLGANMTVNSLTFNDATPVTIAADGSYLTLNSGGTGASSAISVNQDATINAALVLSGGRTITAASGKTLSIGGDIAGTGSLTVTGPGTVTLSGASNYGGGTTVNGGATLNYTSSSSVQYQGGANPLTVQNATVNVAGFVDVNRMDISTNGAVNVTGGTLLNRASTSNGGQSTIGSGSYGMLNISGGLVEILGNNGAANPQNQSTDGRIYIGNGGTGMLRVSGGTLTIPHGIYLGGDASAGNGELTITGGMVNHGGPPNNNAGPLHLARSGTAFAVANIAGGFFDNSDNQITIAQANGTAGSNLGILNLNAGTLYSKEFTQGTGSMGFVNFNGGTLKLGSATSTTALTPAVASTSSFNTYINGAFGAFAGGATIDTNGVSTTIANPLLAPAGNGLSSISVSSGGSNYVGAPLVTIGDSGVLVAGVSTAGSNTITGLGAGDIANMFVGQLITGTGIPAGAVITSVGINSVTMSQNATANNLGQTVKGTGATAYATISGGAVTGFVVTNPGVGYVGTVTAALTGGFTTGGSTAVPGTISTAANTSGGLTKLGTGTLTLTGDGTYTGTTTINDGTLQIGNGGTTGAIGGTSAIVNNTALILNRSNTMTQGSHFGAISGPGTVTKSGTGTTVFAGTNSYSGVTTINAGILQLDSTGALPGGIAATGGISPLVFNGGVLGLGFNDFQRNLGTATDPTAVNFTSTGGWAAYGADRAVNLGGASAPITWATANTGFNGQLLVLGAPTATHTVDLQNPINLTNATRTVRADDGAAAIDGKISGIISGVAGGNFTKTGSGTLELSANNTYSGTTTISAGTLIFSGANFGSNSNVTVSSGAVGQFNSLLSIPNGSPGGGRTVTDSGTVVFGPAFGAANIPAGMLRIAIGSTGAVAADNYSATNFDFQAAGLTNASLGAVGNVTYTGTLTPNGTTYRLGGGGGILTMANTNALTGANAVSIVGAGTVVLAASNNNTGITTINAGGTLHLGTGVSGENGSVGGHIVNNSTLIFNNFDNQDFDCVVSGTGTVTKNGAGTLTLNSKQTYAGATTVIAGTLALAGGDNTLAANKTLTVNGGTLDLGTSRQYVGPFAGTGGTITGTGGTLTIEQAQVRSTFSGSVDGSVHLSIVRSAANQGDGQGQLNLSLTSVNTTTGSITLIGGDGRATNNSLNQQIFHGFALKDSGRLTNVSAITLNNGTLYINNNASSNALNSAPPETSDQDLPDRVNDSAAITLNGGRIHFLGRASTNSTETLGAVTVNSGMSTIHATPGGTGTNSAELTLTSLTRNDGAILMVDSAITGTLGATGSNNGRIFVTGPLTGNLAPVGTSVGVVPGVFRGTRGASNPRPVGYVAGQGFVPVGGAGGPSQYTGALASAPTDANVMSPSAHVVATGGQTINSLLQNGNITFAAASDRLTIASGMFLQNPNNLSIGTTGTRGELTSGLSTGELFLIKSIGAGSGQTLGNTQVNSVITDNGGTRVKLTVSQYNRSDLNANLFLTAPNTYTGGTVVSGMVDFYLNGAAEVAGVAPIPAAVDPTKGLIINNTTVTMQNAAQQIAASNIVTLNGGSILNLTGASNTLAGIVFNSNGGRGQVPTVANATGGSLLTISGNVASTPTNPSTTPLISVPNVDFSTSVHDITVAALPQGNLINSNGTLTPLNGLTISSVIQGIGGGITKKGTGVLNFTNTNSSYNGQLTIEEGVLNVASVNNNGSNGVLGNSNLAVNMGGSGGRTGTLEYTGGTPGSPNTKPFTMATGGFGGFQVDASATNLTLSGVINGNGGLVKSGLGTLILSNGLNAYSGGTIVNAGTLTASGSGTPLGATTGSLEVSNLNRVDRTTAVVLNLTTSAPTTTGTLSGFIDCPECGNTATINVAAGQLFTVNQVADDTFEGVIAGGATSAFTLGALSTSTLTLTGNSTYDGVTNILAGTLLVNGDNSGATGTVTVHNGGTLGGTGIVGGATTILAGGMLAPGASIGDLTIDDSLDITAGVTATASQSLLFELGANPTGDQVTLTASNTLFIGLGLLEFDDFLFTGSPTAGTYTLFDTNTPVFGTLGASLSGTIGSYLGTLAFGDSGNDIILTLQNQEPSAVPEPSTFVLAALGLAGLGLLAWRQRRGA